ncbi:hypothetical protein SAY87_004824 [Trapa incisa]|uniref:Pentatricopeptide repeat-containing protein n=1 Tax=Trapa incisa TaxID=236973 RepID=A0AAN7JQA3_9MYRT|nr:hypothetical protein SAY87_004824 [Trapa incisa]
MVCFLKPNVFNSSSSIISPKHRLLTLLSHCTSLKHLTQIHAQSLLWGLSADPFLVAKLARSLALTCSEYARCVLNSSEILTPSPWNALIRDRASGDSPREALLLYLGMRGKGISPNEHTIPCVLKSSARISALQLGRGIHGEVHKSGLSGDVYIGNALVSLYGSCKKIRDSCKVFDEIPLRTVVSWNAIMTACIENLWVLDGFSYFLKMRGDGFEFDETTMVVLLSACVEMGSLNLGRWAHSQVIRNEMVLSCKLGTALVDMYTKCGDLRSAGLVFYRMDTRNVWTWSAMILGFAQHGSATEALLLFESMTRSTKTSPNYVTFLGVLCACSHAGLVDDAYKYFRDMKDVHGIEPLNVHYGAMVDVLGRAGCLREALDFILRMPVKPDPVLWRTLLSACTLHDKENKTGVRDEVGRRLLEVEPRRGGNLIMVANMYAESGMWDEAEKVRKDMRNKGLKKMAGESTIEVNGSLNTTFYSGDDVRLGCEDVYHLMEDLSWHMKVYDDSQFHTLL